MFAAIESRNGDSFVVHVCLSEGRFVRFGLLSIGVGIRLDFVEMMETGETVDSKKSQ